MDPGEQKCYVVVEPQSTYTSNTWNNPENLAITKLMVIKEHTDQQDKHQNLGIRNCITKTVPTKPNKHVKHWPPTNMLSSMGGPKEIKGMIKWHELVANI